MTCKTSIESAQNLPISDAGYHVLSLVENKGLCFKLFGLKFSFYLRINPLQIEGLLNISLMLPKETLQQLFIYNLPNPNVKITINRTK